MKVGDKVKVIYDGRPVGPRYEMIGIVKKINPSGSLRIQASPDGEKYENGDPVIYNEIFKPYHTGDGKHYARGWNTLWWE